MTVENLLDAKNHKKCDSTKMKILDAHFKPLAEGKAQFGAALNSQMQWLIEKLYLMCEIVAPKEKITNMKEFLMKNEHPNDGEDCKRQKFFKPKILATSNW